MVSKILGFLIATSITVQTTSITYVLVKYEKITVYVAELFSKLSECENTPSLIPDPCKEAPCDSNGYFAQGKAEGLRLCPKHKQKDCPVCDPCFIPKLEVTDYGFINNHKKLRIVANLGVDTIDAVEIKVKPAK